MTIEVSKKIIIIRTYHLHIIFSVFLFSWVTELEAQRQRKIDKNTFSIGILMGINGTQLDGDFFVGFDKLGFTGGIKAYTYLSESASLLVEILYTQKGSNIPHGTIVKQRSVNDRRISLNYVEIPLLLKLKPQVDKYRAYLEFGPAISRLFLYNITENEVSQINGTVYKDLTNDFNSLEFNIIAGIGFDYKKVDLGFRYNFALSKLYENPDPIEINPSSTRNKEVDFLRNYHMGIVLSYKI